jgi:hypothetical protein
VGHPLQLLFGGGVVEAENARLKKLLAEAELDKAMLKELAEGKW